jgi:hypothetical protein
MYNPWEDEPEYYDEGDLVDMAFEAQRDRRLMEITHGHPAQEASQEEEYV